MGARLNRWWHLPVIARTFQKKVGMDSGKGTSSNVPLNISLVKIQGPSSLVAQYIAMELSSNLLNTWSSNGLMALEA